MDNKESILNKINKLIDKYNNISENDKLKIVNDKLIDAENLYICLYDEDQVGLFKNNVAIYLSTILTSREKWYNNGEKIQVDGKDYFATCKINSAYNLESFKLMMYHEGIINDSNINMIFSSEIPEMINYAYSYFNVSGKQKVFK